MLFNSYILKLIILKFSLYDETYNFFFMSKILAA